MGLKSPGPAEVIRASQRDNEFIKELKQDIDEMVLEVFGQRVWMRWQDYSQYASSLVYYALTNLMNNQTLGEEYVGVIQVDRSGRSIPSKKAMSLMIFTQVLGTPFMNYILQMIENFKDRQAETTPLPKYLTELLNIFLRFGSLCQRFAPMLSQLHLAAFYMYGRFYHFSKRITGIQYILIRNYFGNTDATSKKHLKYLMWMSLLNLAVASTHDSFNYILSSSMKRCYSYQLAPSLKMKHGDEQSSSSVSEVDPTKKCSLCLEARRYSSVTPCGHMYCWECIIDWLRNEGACPVCREPIAPSKVVPLQNVS